MIQEKEVALKSGRGKNRIKIEIEIVIEIVNETGKNRYRKLINV